jgi:WD40 repeat protein/energy-coupling factor transporter ATP-binding protein EcfA2
MNASEFKLNLAVVIGINDYHNGVPTLGTARQDAEAIADILKTEYQYQVHLITDTTDTQATSKNLQNYLETKLPEILKKANPSRLLFYFAGHGIALNGDDGPQGYLIPQDAKLGDVSTYLPMQMVEAAITKLSCRHCLVILDCCFAGAFRWSSTRKLSAMPETIHKERYDRFIQDPAWQVITSAASDQCANDSLDIKGDRGIAKNNTRHSPFAAALMEALSGKADAYPASTNGKPSGDGVITATELYMYLRDAVEPATQEQSQRQTPGLWPLKNHDKGEYIFLAPGHPLNLPPAPPLDESKNPYRGLESFEEEHSAFFFGRTASIEKLYEFVSSHPLTVVLGASGSGKSSLVKAGLVPHLKQQLEVQSNQQWQILAPFRPGESPLKTLNNILAREKLAGDSITQLGIDEKVASLSSHLAAWSQQHPNQIMLLVIDQFEELITLCKDEQEREQFLALLAEAIAKYPKQLRLVLTLRSDFEPQFRETALKNDWNDSRFVVSQMTRADLREAIEKPAEKRVMYFDPHELVEQLIDEVADMPGALPLLSFGLSELYLKYLRRQRDAQNTGNTIDRSLTQADYQSMGGIIQSLTQRADEEYELLVKKDSAYAQIIRQVMLRMVAIGGGELARRQVPLSELEYPGEKNGLVKEVIERFTNARLLVKGEDTEGKFYAEPAHDALVRGWQKLLIWKQEGEESLILQRRLTPEAEKWNEIKEKEKQPNSLGKAWGQTESFAIGKIQTWRRNNQSKRQAKANISRTSDVKSIAYLWDDDPRIEQLNQVLDSGNSWLNWIEDDFIRRSLLQKGKNTYRLSLIVTGVIASLAGLSILALIQLQYSSLREKAATVRNQLSASPLNSLVLAIQATGESSSRLRQVLSPVEYSLSAAVAESREQLLIRGHEGSVKSVALSPDGQTIISGGEDGTIRLWDLTGKQINLFQGHEEKHYKRSLDTDYVLRGVNSVTVSPNGQTIASGGDDGTVRLWDLQGQQIQVWRDGHKKSVTSVAFSPNGDRIVSLSENSLWLWNRQTDTVTKLLSVEQNLSYQYLTAFAFSPDGKYITASLGRNIILWDINGNKLDFQQRSISSEEGSHLNIKICSIVFSQDSKSIYTGTCQTDGSFVNPLYRVDVWRIEEEEKKSLIQESEQSLAPQQGDILSLAASPNGMIAVGAINGTIQLSSSPAEVSPILRGHTGRVNSLAFSTKEQKLVSASNDGTIRLWDLSDHFSSTEVEYEKDFPSDTIHAVVFNPKGNNFAIARKNSVMIFNKEGNQVKQTFEHPLINEYGNEPINSIAYSPDGKTIVSGSFDKTLRLWDLEGNRPPVVFQGHENQVNSVAFSPDGKIVVSGSIDNTVRLWNLEGKQLQVSQGHKDSVTSFESEKGVTSVAFSPDGKTIISGAADKTLRLWDLQGKQLQVFQGHEDRVTSVAFSPDGKTIVSGSADKTLRFWDLQGRPVSPQVVRAHTAAIQSVGFSPNGKMILSAGNDKMLKFWSLDGSPASVPFQDSAPGGISVFAISPDSKTILTGMGGAKDYPTSLRMIQNNWEKWLELACNRLHNHPTLLNPQTDIEKGARATCEVNAWH